MTIKQSSYLFIAIALAVMLFSFVPVLGHLRREQQPVASTAVQARRPQTQNSGAITVPTTTQVVVGTPEYYDRPVSTRYTYRNEYPADRTQRLPLYLIDNETGQETRLGDDRHAATFGTMNDDYLLWFYWGEGIHLYTLATGEDRFIYTATSTLPPQIAGDWIAFGRPNRAGESPDYTLFAANITTNEVLTLTRRLNTPMGSAVDLAFGISKYLATWFETPGTIVGYDLHSRREISRLTEIYRAFNELPSIPILEITPGETVITWSRFFGYDLVTHSYFRLGGLRPPEWDNAPIANMSRVQEENRVLTWYFDMQDGSQRHVRAPLLDATPSTAPCIAGQNLVQNGDLETTADHRLWQQNGSTTNLLVNDPPTGLANGGQWALRLGRFNNAQQSIQQTVAIPSGVKDITLSFDVRVHSWDMWGGDQLQVDLVDPITGASILATPVHWTNVQLASGDWIPMQVEIQAWPGIDTPVQLVFRTQTDWAFPTDFTLDNIRFTTACQ